MRWNRRKEALSRLFLNVCMLARFCLLPLPVILPVSITSFDMRSWPSLSHSALKHFYHCESMNNSALSSNDGICDRRQTAQSRARRSVRRRAATEVGSNSGQPARGSPASLCSHITQTPLKAVEHTHTHTWQHIMALLVTHQFLCNL